MFKRAGNYVIDVNGEYADAAVEVLAQFSIRGEVFEAIMCEKYTYDSTSIASFYVRCYSDTLKNIEYALNERGVDLI